MRRIADLQPQPARQRRGGVMLWAIAGVPMALAMLALVTDFGNLWLARVELENAVEAAALAGAQQWGDRADDATNRTRAHNMAKAFGESNVVVGKLILVDSNDNNANTNNNASPTGAVLLGQLTGETFHFNTPPAAVTERACKVEVAYSLPSLWKFLGTFTVRASSAAAYNNATEGAGFPRLVRVTSTVP